MEKPRCLPLIHVLTKSGPLLSERLILSLTPELNQMPTLNFLCKKLNMIMLSPSLKEPALLLVDFRPTLNCLMRPRGELKPILIQISSVLNTEIDIIKQNPSTKKPWLILTAESTKKRTFMMLLIKTRSSTQRLEKEHQLNRELAIKFINQDKA